jgi:tetratricopeptide (TPR) repeat protein
MKRCSGPGRMTQTGEMRRLHASSTFSKTPRCKLARGILGCAVVLAVISGFGAAAPSPAQQTSTRVEGKVRDSGGRPVADVPVFFLAQGVQKPATARTDANGVFSITTLHPGSYSVWAEKFGSGKSAVAAMSLSAGESREMDLILLSSASAKLPSGASPSSNDLGKNFKFKDEPNFTVAGLTDWTNAGGHGSDVHLRASETLTQETLTLEPENASKAATAAPAQASVARSATEKELRQNLQRAPRSFDANRELGEFCLRAQKFGEAISYLKQAYAINSADNANAYDLAQAYSAAGEYAQARRRVEELLKRENKAEFHRLLGEICERMDDPLGAVREYEQAVRLDPSEPNYFAWGTELLYHRAVEPAIQVFSQGSQAHPKSARLLMGLAVALYARGSNAQAAQRLGEASDLDPAAPGPYLFMGRMESAVRAPIPGVQEKLARFLRLHPDDAFANYYYAVSLWKRDRISSLAGSTARVEALLRRAIELDPKLAAAYLQMGILDSDRQNFPEAIRAFQQAIKIDPSLEEAHYRLAQAYTRNGDEAKAKDEFRLYEQLDRQKAAETQIERRKIQQFVIVLRGQPSTEP